MVFVTKYRHPVLTEQIESDELKPYYWKPVFWKRGYCAVSGGGASLDVIKAYIQSQGKDN
jgi:REP element-mobilizing transposase RayT